MKVEKEKETGRMQSRVSGERITGGQEEDGRKERRRVKEGGTYLHMC